MLLPRVPRDEKCADLLGKSLLALALFLGHVLWLKCIRERRVGRGGRIGWCVEGDSAGGV